MNSKQENWIRTFDIPETTTHKDGYTIYKIISFLYPESCPDAVTKLIVWKRFNDFKTLHKNVKKLQKKLKIEENPPNLPKSVIFKRFHEDTISTRKNSILSLLDYIGKYSEFFTSTIFAKFFETDLLEEDENDTDSFCSYNNTTNLTQQETCSLNNKQLNPILEGYQAGINNYLKQEENPEYLLNASLHLNIALELENDKNFDEAYKAYKTTVDILLKGVETDEDYDRKRLIRFKIEQSLNQAEKLYNMYLAPEVQQFNKQKNIELNNSQPLVDNNSVLKGSLYNLYKYKVIKIIWPFGMLVLHSEEQQLFYIKVIHKSVNFSYNELILPQNVPNMVKLINHYHTDDAVYLILEYFSSNKLRDVLANQQTNNLSISETTKYDEIINDEQISFSELLNVYSQTDENVDEECCCNNEETDEDFEFISKTDLEQDDSSATKFFYPYNNNISTASSIITNNTGEFEEIDKKNLISEKQVIKWASQLLLALEKLHSLGVNCNGYLNINHLLIDEENNLHLTYKCSINNSDNKEVSSYNYNNNNINSNLAPEVYNLNLITEAADWWSFGAILYELLVGIPLSEIYTNGFGNYTNLMIPKYVSIEGKSLLKQLLNFEPDERLGGKLIGIEYLKVHPFFRGINWEKLI